MENISGQLKGVQGTIEEGSKDTKIIASKHLGIAKEQASIEDIEVAQLTVSTIEDKSFKTSTLVEIVRIQVKSGDIEGAKAIASTIEDEFAKANAFGTIARAETQIQKAQAVAGGVVRAQAICRGGKLQL